MHMAQTFIFDMYLGQHTIRELLEFIYHVLEHVNPDQHASFFGYQYLISSEDHVPNWLITVREDLMRNIKLFINNSLTTLFRNENDGIHGMVEDVDFDEIDACDLSYYMISDHKLAKQYKLQGLTHVIVYASNLHTVNLRTLIHSLGYYIKRNFMHLHRFEKVTSDECEQIIRDSKEDDNDSDDSRESELTTDIHFIGTITNNSLTMGLFFRLLHLTLLHPERKLNQMLDEYRSRDLNNQLRYGFDAFMHATHDLTPRTPLLSYDILGYMYATAKSSDIDKFFQIASSYLEYYRGNDTEFLNYPGLQFPIIVRRPHTDDEWIMAFILNKDLEEFNTVFKRKTKCAPRAFSIHNDKVKKIKQREWCVCCTKFVLIVTSAGSDKQINIIKFHPCYHRT
jgi:hypothetical protein